MAKILLVEDDNNLREIYEARLQAEGYTIVSAVDGEEALVVAKKEKPDLVISDVMMPRISGFEMLDILRNTEGLKNVKVIMLTALGQAEDKTRADSLGADRYLVKSQVTLEDIVKAAHELLGPEDNNNPSAPQAMAAAFEQAALLAQRNNGQAAVPGAAPAPAPAIPVAPAPVVAAVPVTPVPEPTAPAEPTPAATAAPSTPAEPTAPTTVEPAVAPAASTPAPAMPPTPTPSPMPPATDGQAAADAAEPVVPASTPAPEAADAPAPAAAPAPAPEPSQAEPAAAPEPAPVAETQPASTAQSSFDEEAAIKAQIENFVNQNAQTTPAAAPTPSTPEQDDATPDAPTPTPAPVENETGDAAMADAIKNLVSDTNATPTSESSTPKVIEPPAQQAPPMMPQPNVISPQPATTPVATPAPAAPTTAAPAAPAPEEQENDNVSIAHKKIISPITHPDAPTPTGLDELLAKEGITSLDDEHPSQTAAAPAPGVTGLPTTPHPPGHVISPNAGSDVDPNSIAL